MLFAHLKDSQICHAGKDGECDGKDCPQEKDEEPESTGRFCPLPGWGDEEDNGKITEEALERLKAYEQRKSN